MLGELDLVLGGRERRRGRVGRVLRGDRNGERQRGGGGEHGHFGCKNSVTGPNSHHPCLTDPAGDTS